MEHGLIVLAGLMGAAGVALTAAGAHARPGTGLDSAGYLLLLHAAAIVGGLGILHSGLVSRLAALIALTGFVLGAALFAGDVALRAFAGHRLFPMAAPSGGVILIAAWLVLSVAAVVAVTRSS
jgi:uncharacterized membrane protein YgdD (TMEM256/DUF423 family)